MEATEVKYRQEAPLHTRSDLPSNAVADLSASLSVALADVFALYLKTKNFHWHASGPRFREIHLMLDDQASQLLAMIDVIAERARKIGGTTIRSVGHVASLQRVMDNNAEFVTPEGMISELREDNLDFVRHLRALHVVCDDHNDLATASLIENWIDEAEGRVWFLFEASR